MKDNVSFGAKSDSWDVFLLIACLDTRPLQYRNYNSKLDIKIMFRFTFLLTKCTIVNVLITEKIQFTSLKQIYKFSAFLNLF